MPHSAANFEVRPHPAARHVGQSLNKQGNELALHRRDPGRTGSAGTNPRFSTGVNPLPPVTPGAVFLPRG